MTELMASVILLCACGHSERRHGRDRLCNDPKCWCTEFTAAESALVIEPAPDPEVSPERPITGCETCEPPATLPAGPPAGAAGDADAAASPAALARLCEAGCGCRYGTDDPDRLDCGCPGACCWAADEEWFA